MTFEAMRWFRLVMWTLWSWINIYIKAKTSSESAWGPVTWHSNIAFNLFYLFPLSFFYCYPINHSNLFLLSYKFSIFYLFLLSFFFYRYPINHSNLLHFYCYLINHSNLFLLLYKFSIFYLFSKFFLLLPNRS